MYMLNVVVLFFAGVVGAFVVGRRVAEWFTGDGLALLVGLLAAAAWLLYFGWYLVFSDE